MMDEFNVGALPVCDGERLIGMVTDRDITVRGTAAGRTPHEAHVDEVMSTDVRWCFEDQPLDEVLRQMADTQIRRVPVVSHDDEHKLIGIVALGDLVTKATEGAQKREVVQTVEKVSTPSEPDLPRRTADNADFAARPNTGTAQSAGGGTARKAGAAADTAGNTENTGETGAPGGTAGTGGAGGTGVGAKP
jgi:CBS-domain-containing membrane protein